MTHKIPNIFFYIPSKKIVTNFDIDINSYWLWINSFIKKTPIDLPNNRGKCTIIGPYNWTIQTYIYLKLFKYNCQLTDSLDVDGIIISHSDFLPRYIKPISTRYIVEIKPDRSLMCLLANFVVTQNANDPTIQGYRRFFISSHWVNYWPQPSIIKRNRARGNKIKNICYIGKPEQFINDINGLKQEVKSLGFNFKFVPREKWNDYSNIDVIVAVRPSSSFSKGKVASNLSLNKKPASKLINAWIAGVPAILSPDDAFLKLKKSDDDFLQASNQKEIIQQLKKLKNEPEVFDRMIKNGAIRSKDIQPEIIAREWISLIQEKIIPKYFLWRSWYIRRFFTVLTRLIFYPKLLKFVYKDLFGYKSTNA